MPNISDMPTAVPHSETVYRRPILELADGTDAQVPQQNVQFTVGAEDTNVIAVTVQTYDYNDLLERYTQLYYYMSSDASGATAIAIDDIGIGSTTGTIIEETTANASGIALTDSDGTLILALTEATASQASYLCISYGESNKVFTQLVTWDGS
jgi:hypothetical protein